MPRLVGPRDIWTFLGFFVGSLVALPLGARLSMELLERPHPGVALRALAVLIGVAALLPLVALMRWLYRRSDEFERQRLLQQLAVAFAVNALLGALLDQLHFASFVSMFPVVPSWWIALASWGIAMVVVNVASRVRG